MSKTKLPTTVATPNSKSGNQLVGLGTLQVHNLSGEGMSNARLGDFKEVVPRGQVKDQIFVPTYVMCVEVHMLQ
jgi:hypothetical protein